MTTDARLTPAEIETLRRFDSPTIANAIEPFGVRPLTTGFMGMDIRCMFPEMGVMVGYAVTAALDSQTEEEKPDKRVLGQVLENLDKSPKPAVLVFQDVGPRPSHSCHFGDSLANLTHRLGAVGLVTNGGIRDLAGCRELGFQYYAPGVTVSHGNYRYVSAGEPVEVSGVTVHPGDLIHADENGVVLIPADIARAVAAKAEEVAQRETELIAFYRSEAFSLEDAKSRIGIPDSDN
ncbi:MAG: RraA family protein [Chloroflexota bacterium]